MKPKILILTASFGDGHNSAARHLAEALRSEAEVKVADPCHLGNPIINRLLCQAYREVTTYTPRIWSWIYQSTDRQDFRKPLPFIAKTEDAVASLLSDFKPDLVLNTYPLYPYMVERLFQRHHRVPILTVITDSIEINSAWSRSPSDHFFITDGYTLESLTCQGIPEQNATITGFPVSHRFKDLQKLNRDASISPFRVLFFPTARSPHVTDIIDAVLSYETHITVVLGRNFRRLYRKTAQLKKKYPGRMSLKGWTRRVPELLCSHHLVIGKAGGATVHEAIAAECPMLVHHIVPGQEEGNIELLQRYGIGSLATNAGAISEKIQSLLINDGEKWREQKMRLSDYSKPNAAQDAAQQILSHLSNR